MIIGENTQVTLWLVTLVNHNVTSIHKTKIPYERESRKATCDIVVGQCHQCHYHNVTQVLPDYWGPSVVQWLAVGKNPI
jgi:hypothetical protein